MGKVSLFPEKSFRNHSDVFKHRFCKKLHADARLFQTANAVFEQSAEGCNSPMDPGCSFCVKSEG
jgi:hypothetical protein